MSGYGKTSQAPEYDSRPAQSHYSSIPSPYGSYTPQSHYSAGSSQPLPRHRSAITSEQSAQHPPTALVEPLYGSRQYGEIPQIIGSEPRAGTEGTSLSVHLHSATDLTTDPRSFRLVFGSFRSNTAAPKPTNRSEEYQITVPVPPFRSTAWRSSQVKVFLLIEDEDGQQLAMEEVPNGFAYPDSLAPTSYSSPPRATLKRKASGDSAEMRAPAKRIAGQPLRPKSEDFGSFGYPHANGPQSQYTSTYATNANSERSYGVYSSYDDSANSGSYQPQTSPRNFPYSYAGLSELSHASAGPAAAGGWPSQFGAAPSTDTTSVLAPPDLPNPTLIRTSTLTDKGEPGSRGPPGFNPYSIYPHKAVLQIQGDLSDMAKHWTAEEWDSKRRLVQFWRQQRGNTIHTTFRPIPQSDRPTSAVCVSCIWWAERNECYVTSVDCIYLLESLIAVRFTVEEKNRIRRNLEGFRPLTVSKGKKDCESFFKLIMQFPSPKPRNIEKDVKVFAWSILPHALKKIIGKYSASYSSTASIIPPVPGASPYPGAPPHEQPHTRPSDSLPPRKTPSPVVGDTCVPTSSSIISPGTAALPGGSVSAASPVSRGSGISDNTHISLPGIAPVTSAHGIWQQPQTLPAATHPLPPASGHRGSWDVSFLEPGSGAASSNYYPREHPVPGEDRANAPGGPRSSPHASNVNVP